MKGRGIGYVSLSLVGVTSLGLASNQVKSCLQFSTREDRLDANGLSPTSTSPSHLGDVPESTEKPNRFVMHERCVSHFLVFRALAKVCRRLIWIAVSPPFSIRNLLGQALVQSDRFCPHPTLIDQPRSRNAGIVSMDSKTRNSAGFAVFAAPRLPLPTLPPHSHFSG